MGQKRQFSGDQVPCLNMLFFFIQLLWYWEDILQNLEISPKESAVIEAKKLCKTSGSQNTDFYFIVILEQMKLL